MFRIGYLYEVFLVHLDQAFAVTVQSEFGGVEEVIITAPGSVLESRYFPVHRGEPYVWRKEAAIGGDNGSSSTGIPLVSPLKEDVSHAMYRRSIYTEIKKLRWVVRTF